MFLVCSVTNTISVSAAESFLVLTFDTLVFALTFYKTFQLTRDTRNAGIHSGLGEVVLRDGERAHSFLTSMSSEQREIGLVYSW